MKHVVCAMFAACSALCVSGCGLLLDLDPPDPVSRLDAARDANGFTLDAGSDTDAAISTDAGMDAEVREAGVSDGSIASDAEAFDADVFDADDGWSPDAGSDPDGGDLPCEIYDGVCVRFTNTAGNPPIVAWWHTHVWNEGFMTVSTGWSAATCLGGIRTIDRNTTECRFRETPLSGRLLWFYPSYHADGSTSVCSPTACPRSGLAGWFRGVPIASAEFRDVLPEPALYSPAVDVRVMEYSPP